MQKISFLQRTKNFLGRVLLKALPYSWEATQGVFEELGKEEDINYYTSWAYAGITKIAQGIARSQWKLYQLVNKNVKEIEDHDILGLLHKVNAKMTEFDFKELLIINGEIYGHMPIILFRDSEGKPNEVWPALPFCLSPKVKDKFGNVEVWQYKIGNQKMEFKAEDVIDLKYPNPKNPFEGFAPINAIKDILDLDRWMNKWNVNLLQNNARPPIIIKLPHGVTDEQKKVLEDTFKERYQGYEKAYKKVMFVTAGTEVDKAGFSPNELEFKDSKIQLRDEILSILGVPKSILGLEANVPRASMEQAERNFSKHTLEPKLRKITEQLNEFLVPQFGEDLYLDFEPLAQEDRELRLQEFDKGHNRWLSTNEIKRELGLPDIKGGNYIYQPIGLQPSMGSKSNKVQKLEVKTEGVNLKKQKEIRKAILARTRIQRKKVEEISLKFQKALDEKKKVVLKIVDKKSINEKSKKIFWEARIKRETLSEKKWKDEFLKIFQKQKKELLDNLKKKKSQKNLTDEVMIDERKWVKTTLKIIEPLYIEDLMAGSAEASELVGMGTVDIMKLPRVKNWLEYTAKKYSKDITETTIEDLAARLNDGLREGEGIYELGNRVEDYFKTITPDRADMIARTETARATVEAHGAAWEEMGFEKAEWLLAPDACPICEDKAKQKWEMKSIEGEIPVHPNCKCDFTPE